MDFYLRQSAIDPLNTGVPEQTSIIPHRGDPLRLPSLSLWCNRQIGFRSANPDTSPSGQEGHDERANMETVLALMRANNCSLISKGGVAESERQVVAQIEEISRQAATHLKVLFDLSLGQGDFPFDDRVLRRVVAELVARRADNSDAQMTPYFDAASRFLYEAYGLDFETLLARRNKQLECALGGKKPTHADNGTLGVHILPIHLEMRQRQEENSATLPPPEIENT